MLNSPSACFAQEEEGEDFEVATSRNGFGFQKENGRGRGGEGFHRGGRGDFRGRGGFNRGGGDFGGNRGRGGFGRGASNEGGANTFAPREGDWPCSDSACGNNNFAWRTECHRCQAPRSGESSSETNGGGGFRGGRGGFGAPRGARGGFGGNRGGRGSFGDRGGRGFRGNRGGFGSSGPSIDTGSSGTGQNKKMTFE